MKKPKISVQIVTWKRKDLLKDLIESLENQSLDKDIYEICICDSDSNDGTAEAVQLLSNKYSNIKYFNISTNTLTAKRNYLFNQTESPIIITLDDDLLACNTLIQCHLEAQQNSLNTIFCGQVRFNQKLIKKYNYYRYRDSSHLREGMKGINLSNLPAKNIVVMNMSFKKEEITPIGFMNEEFIKYGAEDTEFGIRVNQNNIRIVYLNSALVYHLENSELDGYLKKLYVTARYGYKKLFNINPKAEFNSSINLLMPIKKNDKFQTILKKALLKILLTHCTLVILSKYLKMTDCNSIFYSHNLYKLLYACSIKKGINDQSKMEDNNAWL